MNDLEQYLRDNKPRVKDNPTFLLETRRRLEAVEGLKNEVDRQRHSSRRSLIIALAASLLAGTLAATLAYLYPVDASIVGKGLLDYIRLFLDSYKQYLLLPTALLAIALGLFLSRSRRSFI